MTSVMLWLKFGENRSTIEKR